MHRVNISFMYYQNTNVQFTFSRNDILPLPEGGWSEFTGFPEFVGLIPGSSQEKIANLGFPESTSPPLLPI